MIVLSHTDIAAFLRCRRKFNWGYVLDYQAPDKVHGALALGERVHAALEDFYRLGVDPVTRHQELAVADMNRADSEDMPHFVIDQLHEDIIVGRNCIEAYMDWLEQTGADQGYVVDAVEDEIEAPILDGSIRLRGKVDVRFRRESDGALILDDFKTTGLSFANLRAELERSYQHRVYLMIQREIERLSDNPQPVGGARYTMIKKATKRQRGQRVEVERFDVPGVLRGEEIDRQHIMGICFDIIEFLNKLGDYTTDRTAYPTPAASCEWCDYKVPCLLADDIPEAAVEFLDREYIRGRHARYDSSPT